MARSSDITSTERLLKVIRSRKDDIPMPVCAGPAEPLARETDCFEPLSPGEAAPSVSLDDIGPPCGAGGLELLAPELASRSESPATGLDARSPGEATPPVPLDGIEPPCGAGGLEFLGPELGPRPESSPTGFDAGDPEEAVSPAPSAVLGPSSPKTGRFKIPLPGMISLQKSSMVGIDIGHDCLRLVRAAKTSGGKWKILDRRRFDLPPKTSRDAPEFSSFLKGSLTSACGSAKQSDLWVIMSAANVDVRHIRIPKVSRRQVANAVYWTVKKETPFDEKEMLLDFQTQGEVVEQGISKMAVMVYLAPRREIEELRTLFSRIGWPLTGISIASFAMQNLFRTGWIPNQGETVATLFIGNNFSRIDIFSEAGLAMTRGIKAGLSSMVETLVYRFNEDHRHLQAPPLTLEQGRKIVLGLSPDSPPLRETDAGFALSKGEVFEMIEPALERLARQVTRTFEHHTTTTPGEPIARLYVSGASNNHQPIVDYLGAQLGMASAVLDPLAEQNGGETADGEDDCSVSERVAFGPALGLAFSSNDHTPNLLFTYKDKEREASVIRINRSVFALFIVSVLICAGIFLFQNHAIGEKKRTLAAIETQIAALGPPVDQNRLLQMAARVTQRRQLSRGYAERYLGMVLISELAELTPPNIRLTDLKINLGPVERGDSSKQARNAPRAQPEEVTVEGLILGERPLFETSLASYVMTLEASPLFRQVAIRKSTVESYIKGETLHFILILKVEAQAHG